MTMNIDTLATALGNTLGSGWTVTASFDQVTAITPLYDRITITPLIYGFEDVRWALMPQQRHVAGVVIAEIPTADATAEIAASLRSLSYRHHALPATV